MDSGSEGETEPANPGEAYQLLLDTLPSGKEVLSATGRPSKRQRTTAGGKAVAKQTKAQPQTAATHKQVRECPTTSRLIVHLSHC